MEIFQPLDDRRRLRGVKVHLCAIARRQDGCLFDLGVIDEVKIVVRAEHEHLALAHPDFACSASLALAAAVAMLALIVVGLKCVVYFSTSGLVGLST